MKLQKKSHHKRTTIVITTVVVLVVIAFLVYFFLIRGHNSSQSTGNTNSDATRSTNSVDYGKASADQIKAGDQIKSDGVKGNNTDTPPSPSAQPGSNKKVAAISITANAKDKTSQTYQIRFQIDALVENGTCALTLTKGSAIVTKTADVQNLSNTSTCKGFDIPISALSSGSWQLSLKVDSTTITGTLNSSINVQ
jgi:hypothetical protein